MYYVMCASAPSLHRESTDSLIMCLVCVYTLPSNSMLLIKSVQDGTKIIGL